MYLYRRVFYTMGADMIKNFLGEMLGTFIFLSVIICVIENKQKGYFKGDAWLKIGLALAIMVVLVGPLTGANLNPALTICLYLNDEHTLENVGVYIVAQLIGAVLAVCFYKYYKTELDESS